MQLAPFQLCSSKRCSLSYLQHRTSQRFTNEPLFIATMASSPATTPDIRDLLTPIAKYKLRSHETSLNSHLPLLQPSPTNQGPSIIFLGDSMFERFLTTGSSPNFPAPWPSPTLLPTLPADANSTRLPHVFNAGVGGDKIQNISYRLLGSDSADNPLLGLAAALANVKSVKLWVLHAGTNNLTAKKGLSDVDVEALEAVVRAVLAVEGAAGTQTRVILTGLHYRKDIPDERVDEANGKLRGLVGRLNADSNLGGMVRDEGRVSWLGAASGIRREEHLVDHVHLSLEGYQIWVGEVLFPGVVKILKEMGSLESVELV
ncbi:SGNH hydrolase-type esterase domain-containing protein [Immersiella caudata]|uniref:SGNH hydrolase-type esterase domain-containing protein n=1 Tax=Immersiella caudata TaxID=314043 RepID=A0AA39WYC8_9PEZI|nr:SGNH hydrolase-type esterase domain-containing protein [Immersiella caudata]